MESYKIQLQNRKRLLVQTDDARVIILELSRLVTALQEVGFVITYPPSRLVSDIQEFLKQLPDLDDFNITVLGNVTTVGMFLKNGRMYSVSLAPTKDQLNVDIYDCPDNQRVFCGYVESLDEFKLIWSRIL